MCQAIVKPAETEIDKEILRRAWKSNPDGGGFAYVENGAVVIRKGFRKFKTFWSAYRHYQHQEVIIHFRFATHGAKGVDNCHPFPLAPDAALIHNGILSHFIPPATASHSDTREFLNVFLLPMLKVANQPIHGFLSDAGVKTAIEHIIGFNKLAVLTPEGHIIFNENLGEWVEGAWYSAGFPHANPWLDSLEDESYRCWGRAHEALELIDKNYDETEADSVPYSNPRDSEYCQECMCDDKPLVTMGPNSYLCRACFYEGEGATNYDTIEVRQTIAREA